MADNPLRVKGLRKQLYKRYNGICMWCGKRITFDGSSVEHIKPLAEGGTSDPANLGLSCKRCNNNRRL
jgi:5-methylcytosine-specific restriction endonuclease McrA